jgi:uncharacterized DUF497 family protein
MKLHFSGFEWDKGNWPKCGKHGLSQDDIEYIFLNKPGVHGNPTHSTFEERFKAIGKTKEGRYTYISFTLRKTENGIFIRPISARYMHQKEIDHYERQKTTSS